jgi:hypothetical protein
MLLALFTRLPRKRASRQLKEQKGCTENLPFRYTLDRGPRRTLLWASAACPETRTKIKVSEPAVLDEYRDTPGRYLT